MTFFSSDTNVLYLIIKKNTSISMALSVQQIEQLWDQTEQKLCQDSMHSLGQTTLGLLG